MHVVLDTGVQGILLYKARLLERVPRMRMEGEVNDVQMGCLRAMRVKLSDVQTVGPAGVSTVFLIKGPPVGPPDIIDGYLGPTALKARQVEFDFGNGVFRWH
jgi:hypothetical protein